MISCGNQQLQELEQELHDPPLQDPEELRDEFLWKPDPLKTGPSPPLITRSA
jgi:hypothetical protein